jgi:hypothetical protein
MTMPKHMRHVTGFTQLWKTLDTEQKSVIRHNCGFQHSDMNAYGNGLRLPGFTVMKKLLTADKRITPLMLRPEDGELFQLIKRRHKS